MTTPFETAARLRAKYDGKTVDMETHSSHPLTAPTKMKNTPEEAAELKRLYEVGALKLTETQKDIMDRHTDKTARLAAGYHSGPGEFLNIKKVRMSFSNPLLGAPYGAGFAPGQETFEVKGEIAAYCRDDVLFDKLMRDAIAGRRDQRTKQSVVIARGPFMGCGAICYKMEGKWAWVQFDDTRLPQHHRLRRRDVHFKYRRIRWS